ncbi:hypothetical protein K492DRAFT_171034 [Lichtheimia hyalospora FSU 10163]|nr:hypothetical protein K492DRAFT_171034 [Lichtheimia hyalospora FSU 10163]
MIGVQLVRYQYDGIPLPTGMWSSDDDVAAEEQDQDALHPYDFSHNETHDHSHDEKYLTYLPYSRFSNQRSTLLNAALLAKYLNRTLVVPPMFLGSANGWSPAPGLYQVLANMTDDAFQDRCFDQEENALIEDIVMEDDGERVVFGCYNFTTYAMVPWSWATDLQRLTRSEEEGGLGINILERSDMKLTKLQHDLGLPDDEMYLMQDSTRYQWHIYDHSVSDERNLRYRYEISLKELDNMQYRLLHFYGIFGYDRLMLHDERSEEYRLRIEQSLIFRHPAIGEASSIILEQLLNGVDKETSDLVPLDPIQAQEKQEQEKELPRFVAAHVRAGDGVFLKKLKDRVPEFVHQIWDIMTGNETSTDDLIGASNRINATLPPSRQRPLYPLPKAPYEQRKALSKLDLSERLQECAKRKLMVLYVATDAPDPRSNQELKPIIDAFPCTFFMNDFPTQWRDPVMRVRSPLDPHKDLTQHLIMFVDATICAWAERFIGTRTSTFSNYIKQYRHAIVDEIIEHQGFA